MFVGNALTTDELAEAYGSLDVGAYFQEIRAENDRKMETALGHLRELGIGTEAALLDVGTGDGRFLEKCHEAGFRDLAGHEIPGSAVERARALEIPIHEDHDYGSIPRGRHDCVTLLDVVEHVLDPAALFEACARALRPGGLVYFHTPVVTQLDRLMHVLQRLPVVGGLGRAWQRGRTSVFHLRNYTPRSLRHLLETAGFSQVTIRVRNELSWPVRRYVRVYLCEKQGLPRWLAPVLAPLFWPLLATDVCNSNKAIAWARKAGGERDR